MELCLDCLPCLMKQALDAARKTTDDVEIHRAVMEETLSLLEHYPNYLNSPDLARAIHASVKGHTGSFDPYSAMKQGDLASAKALVPYLKEFLTERETSLYWTMKVSAVGNNLDAAVYSNLDVKRCIEQELDKPFAICDLDRMEEKLQSASRVLIIGDNAGEAVFDKIMIEALPKHLHVTYAVRREPIINDVTVAEATEAGIGEVARILPSGCTAPGTMLGECSEEFLEVYRNSDLIISKGQGNYEALSEEQDLFFLLKAKCPVLARRLNVPLNSYVLKYSGR